MELKRDEIVKALAMFIEDMPVELHLGLSRTTRFRLLLRDALSLIKELTEENERLKSVEFTCGFIKPHKVLECPIFDEVEKTKADTVREMKERLKAKMNDLSRNDGIFGTYYLVSKSFIDQIAKEMIGEANG